MRQHLPALLFLIPLLAGIATPLVSLRRAQWCRPILLLAVLAMSAVSIVNLASVLSSGEIRYAFGGWAPPVGIEWVADRLASVMMVAVSVLAGVCLVYRGTLGASGSGERMVLQNILILLLLAGLTGVVFAADLFNVFVFLEVVALSTCALISMAGGKALVFGFRYLILASIGATLYLLGISYLYAVTGTLNLADLSQRLPALGDNRAVVVGLVFIFIGLAVKMALMPLHGWLPDAYSHAPDAVAPLLSALVTKVALFAWVRILYWMVGAGAGEGIPEILLMCWIMGSLAAVTGAVVALIQHDIKRMFAYGGVSHIGLVMIGAGVGNQTGLAGSMFYLINDAVMQAALFVLAGVAASHYGARTVEEWAGLGWRAPWVTGGLVVVALSMIGIPPTGGFFGKWYIVLGALQGGQYAAAAAVVLATLLTMAYFVALLVRVYGGQPPSREIVPGAMPLAQRICVGALCGAILTLGLWSDRIVKILLEATSSLKL